jgi:hypothetical protein
VRHSFASDNETMPSPDEPSEPGLEPDIGGSTMPYNRRARVMLLASYIALVDAEPRACQSANWRVVCGSAPAGAHS